MFRLRNFTRRLQDYFMQVREFRRDIQLFLVYNLFSNVGIGVFILIFNLYLVQNGFDEGFIGIYNATTTLTLAATSMLMGTLIGRFGGWHCIVYGTLIFVVSSAILALVANPALILLVSLVSGAGTAFLITPIMPFILEWERREHSATAVAFAFSINSLSLTLGSFIGGWSPRLFAMVFGLEIESVMSYRLALLLGLAVVAIGFVPMLKMQRARRRSGQETGEFAALTELPPSRLQVRRDIMVFAGATGILALGIGTMAPFYNVYLNSIGARPSRIGIIFAMSGIAAALVCLIVPAVARRWGPITSFFWIRFAPVPFFLLLAFLPNLFVAAGAHIVRTCALSMSWTVDSNFMGNLLPSRSRASAFSIRSGLWNLGYAIASLVGGWLIVWLGYGSTFIAFAAFTAVSTVLFVSYFRRHPDIREST